MENRSCPKNIICFRRLEVSTCPPNQANAIKGDKIIAWNDKNYQDKSVSQMSKTIMRCIIDFNLQGKKLKSREIYRQIQNRA